MIEAVNNYICLGCAGPISENLIPSQRKRRRYCSVACAHKHAHLIYNVRNIVNSISGYECFEWPGAKNAGGYGMCTLDGRYSVTAHRAAYIIANGSIEDGLSVCHHCDNRPCINPKHLFLGTPMDNAQDAVRKGRFPRGIHHFRSKLTPDQIPLIRADTRPMRVIGMLYGVTGQAILAVKNGDSWAWVK